MVYNVLDVCRHVINYSNEKGYGISNLKLQKILYFIQAYFLISTPSKCFYEKIEAWDFGPVVPEAYREYKQYGGMWIPSISKIYFLDRENPWKSEAIPYFDNVIEKADKERIDAVVDKFSDYSATGLVTLTHAQAPWINAYEKGKSNEITTDAIKEYFDAE